MFEGMSFDELNQLNSTSRSMDIDKYFDEMQISEEEKKRRKSVAEKLEDEFLIILAFLFMMQKYNRVTEATWQEVQQKFEDGYRKAIASQITEDSTITAYIIRVSKEVTDSTKNHQDDEYYYTLDRATFMAECEANNVGSYQEFKEALQAGYTKKQWVTILDGHERETHHEASGQVKNIWEPFSVGGSSMQYPRDLSAPASETVNCRCSMKFIK